MRLKIRPNSGSSLSVSLGTSYMLGLSFLRVLKMGNCAKAKSKSLQNSVQPIAISIQTRPWLIKPFSCKNASWIPNALFTENGTPQKQIGYRRLPICKDVYVGYSQCITNPAPRSSLLAGQHAALKCCLVVASNHTYFAELFNFFVSFSRNLLILHYEFVF